MKTSAKQTAVKFRKLRGTNQYARPWDEFPPAEQLSMLEGVVLDRDEVPVVGIAGKLYPVVMTAKRII